MPGKEKKWKFNTFFGGTMFLLTMCFLVQGMIFMPGEIYQVSSVRSESKQAASVISSSGKEAKKVAYLTFDDGPSVLTTEYLKVLREEEVQATFFLIGQQLEGEMVEVVRGAIADGHEVGMHTYCHVADEIYSSRESYCRDLEKTKLCIEEKLDITPKFFRFPWGSSNSYVRGYKSEVVEYMKAAGVDYVDWNVSGEDSVGCPSADSILNNVRRDYKKYDEPVILLHDSASCKETLYALRGIIRELKAEGYSFATLSERAEPCHFGE